MTQSNMPLCTCEHAYHDHQTGEFGNNECQKCGCDSYEPNEISKDPWDDAEHRSGQHSPQHVKAMKELHAAASPQVREEGDKQRLTEIRNSLYEAIPIFEPFTWDAVTFVKKHLERLDAFIDSMSEGADRGKEAVKKSFMHDMRFADIDETSDLGRAIIDFASEPPATGSQPEQQEIEKTCFRCGGSGKIFDPYKFINRLIVCTACDGSGSIEAHQSGATVEQEAEGIIIRTAYAKAWGIVDKSLSSTERQLWINGYITATVSLTAELNQLQENVKGMYSEEEIHGVLYNSNLHKDKVAIILLELATLKAREETND